MKGIVLIIDGLGDLPIDQLGGKTPLEAAHTPVLDQMASLGRYGLVDPIDPGETPNTHSGVGMLLGMLPEQADRLARGPVEAAGLGFELQSGSVAMRANFATLEPQDDGFVVVDRRAGRIDEGATTLASLIEYIELDEGVSASFRSTDQHRGLLVLSGPGLDPGISDTDPGDRPMPSPLLECLAVNPSARLAALMVNRFIQLAHQNLQDHPVNRDRAAAGLPPANGVITRGAGGVLTLDNIIRDQGLHASVISGCNTVKGLGSLLGFDVVSDPRFTGALDTDLEAKIQAAISQHLDHDLVFVHIKAPDICGHDRQPLLKRDFLEKLDSTLAPLTGAGTVIALASDHTTNSNSGFHTADPVPALLYCPDMAGSHAKVNFGESACRKGNLPRQTSHSLLQEILRVMREN